MIYTSSHNYYKSNVYETYAISGNRGKDANYKGKCYPKLAPKLGFWKVWHENIGKISEEENNYYYIKEYWNQVLSKIDPEEVYKELDNSVLLCYEPNDLFCHRHIVSAWFELFLGIEVQEIKGNGLDIEYDVPKLPYIKEYLKAVIKNSIYMHGFKSIRAAYLYDKDRIEEAYNEDEKINIKTM